MSQESEKTLIVDGSQLLFRAYYGVPESARLPSGLPVNAVYGFFADLRKADQLEPARVVVVFDSETGIQAKTTINSSYKADRQYDTGMYEQLPIIKTVLDLLGIPHVEPPDHEADDYIGSLARVSAMTRQGQVLIFSNDRDFYQLIDGSTSVLRIANGTLTVIGPNEFQETFGFDPTLYPDYLALKGDPTDNVQGVPGIGHKTATELVGTFGTVGAIYEAVHGNQVREPIRRRLVGHEAVVMTARGFLEIDKSILVDPGLLRPFTSRDPLKGKTNRLLEAIGINTK